MIRDDPGAPALQRVSAGGTEAGAGYVSLLAATAGYERAGLNGWSSLRGLSCRRCGRHVDRDIHGLSPTGHGNAESGGNTRCLDGIELADAPGHEEALDEAQNPWNRRPAETGVENAETGVAQIEVVNAKAAQKQRKQNANDLVATHRLILLIEDGLLVGIRDAAHGWLSLPVLAENIRNRPGCGSRQPHAMHCPTPMRG